MIGDARVVERLRAAAVAAGESGIGPAPLPAVLARLGDLLDPRDRANAYLVLGALRAVVPNDDAVTEFGRRWTVDGLAAAAAPWLGAARRVREPFTVSSDLLVDLTDTLASRYVTGIQRVARESAARWAERTALTRVVWTPGARLRAVGPDDRALPGVVLPYRGRLVLPEIAVDRTRSSALASIARHARGTTLAIGFDAIPMTTAETAGLGMPAAFAHYLSTLAWFDTVVPISAASGVEYAGWKRMLAGVGLAGPRIVVADLPYSAGAAGAAEVAAARAATGVRPDDTVVLAVGSHEPRKNHLRLLEAAEILWSAGGDFTLVMVGGNAWRTERFDALVERLRARGRRIVLLRTVDDATLWGLYRIARVSVFASLNEGFGLPLAESLAAGTPAVTAEFGSQGDLGRGHGALLVDPRSAPAMAEAIGRVLADPAEHDRLMAETASVPASGWDRYADRVFDELDAADGGGGR